MSLIRSKLIILEKVQRRTQRNGNGRRKQKLVEGSKTVTFYEVRLDHKRDDFKILVDEEILYDKRK